VTFARTIRVALRSLLAHKLRSFLTMLGMIIGVSCVIAMVSMGEGATGAMKANLTRLGANLLSVRPGSARQGHVQTGNVQTLVIGDAEALATLRGVIAMAPEATGSGQLKHMSENMRAAVVGTTPSYSGIRNLDVESGRFLEEHDLQLRRKVVVIGAEVARRLFQGGTPLGSAIKVGGVNYEVIGVLAAKGEAWASPDERVFVPLTTAQKSILGQDWLTGVTLKCENEDVMPEVQKAIEGVIRERHKIPEGEDLDVQIMNQREWIDSIRQAVGVMTVLLTGVAAVSLIVGGIGIMNIMLVSVTERTREIGVRKALGATRLDILKQFLVEAAVIAAIGGLIGLAVGAGGSYAFVRSRGWEFVLPTPAVALAIGFSGGIGILFGIFPAVKAARLDPIEALRYE